MKNLIRKTLQGLRLSHQSVKKSDSFRPWRDTISLLPAAAPGGLGDEAMVGGALNSLQLVYPKTEKIIIVPVNFDKRNSFNEQNEHQAIFSKWTHPVIEAGKIESEKVFIFGADILDGMYDLADSAKRVRLAGILSESQRDTKIVGFSLNSKPNPKMIEVFNKSKGVKLYLRDPISFARASEILDCECYMTADLAFMLNPSKLEELNLDVYEFVNKRKAIGDRIIGLNVHELLNKFSGSKTYDAMISSLAKLIDESKHVSFILIPHDYRHGVDDRIPLTRIKNMLKPETQQRILNLVEPLRASEIKEICGLTDGVITGRMHIAIAALGMGTPVLGIVYQGKFEGTLAHFDLDKDFAVTPDLVADYTKLSFTVSKWLADSEKLKSKISSKLEYVKELSIRNFL